MLDPFSFIVLPETADVLILGCPTLEVLVLDIYDGLMECARQRVEHRAKPVGHVNYIACRRVNLSVGAMQQQPVDDEQVANQAVERVIGRDPEMVMKPVVEEMERRMVLEQTMSIVIRNGLDPPQFVGWRGLALKRQWSAFRRALGGDPPVKVRPLHVVLEPDARTVKVRSCTYCPMEAAWLAACMSMLMGMVLVVLYLQ